MAATLVRRRLPFYTVLKTQCRSGYIVLLPEAAQDQNAPQTTFNAKQLPEINNLTTEECISLVGKLSLDFESGLWNVEEKCKNESELSPDLFQEVLEPLEKVSAPLDAAWGMMKTLYLTNSKIMTEKCYMTIHERARRARTQKFYNEKIFSACKKQDLTELSEEKKRVVSKYVLEGRLNGLELNNVTTDNFKHTIIDPNVMRDFPENLTKSMAYDRSQYNRGPWTVTLQPHIYSQFMEYCPLRDLRWNVWQAHVRRSSNDGEKSVETSTHIEELRSLRREQAKLLGFESFAHMSMKTKMAGNVENVTGVLERLRKKALLAQEKEISDLQNFAEVRGFEGTLELWDVPYWKRKQLRTLYSFDEEKLKEYFPFPKVLNELFALCKHLFNIEIVQEKTTNVWHPDVQFYNIFDSDSREPIASFFLDPYMRSGEKKGMQDAPGWMITLRNKSKICDHQPLATLLFNFTPPSEGLPCLLTFKDVRQLFSKFGNALQHLLTTATYSDVSGMSNIEWDAVEVCSNFMTHWLYHAETVRSLSSHYKTEEPLPEELLGSLEQLPRLLAGYELCWQLYYSALDLKLHTSKDFWLDIVRELWPQYSMFPLDKRDAHPCSFSAIFSEEWAAAYYCHLWAQVMAADVFSAFQEAGLENTNELASVGKRLRSTFLSLGGSCHPSEVFRRFRGRDPSPNALLWSLGLKKQTTGTPVESIRKHFPFIIQIIDKTNQTQINSNHTQTANILYNCIVRK
ncbi:Uncharacterized protein GBIM_12888, partial [Gryllus bimaculatus]